jgi:hypothetical protein
MGLVEYVLANKEWIFSGIGIAIVAGVIAFIRSRQVSGSPINATSSNNNTNTTIVNVGAGAPYAQRNNVDTARVGDPDAFAAAKGRTRILFIDDDTTFPVVKILKQAGWANTKITKDIRSLDDQDVLAADIFFVDIQGVGKALKFSDQGLGLARALKQKYPQKWLVIYSAEPKTDTFHQAFRIADDRIAKTADPYEFQTIVERFVSTRP